MNIRYDYINIDPNSVPYPKRLEMVMELGMQFPGYIAPVGQEYKNLGFFAGTYLQTQWQWKSGRDLLPIWFFVNYSLTVAPYAYAQEYLICPQLPYKESPFVLKNPTRNVKQAPITQLDTCRAWKEYFKAVDNKDNKCINKLWKAHTTAIRHSLWQYKERFKKIDLPQEELLFWQGWVRLVLEVEKWSPLTNDYILKPLLNLLMPEYAPLGINNYSVSQQRLIRRTFLKFILMNNLPLDRFLQAYGRL